MPPKRKQKDQPKAGTSGVQQRAKRMKFTVNEFPSRWVNKDGAVFVCGSGEVGQLGLGEDVTEKKRFATVRINETIIDVYAGGMHTVCLTRDGEVITFGCNDEGALGRDVSEEGKEFEPGFVTLPGKVKQISAGDSHTAALLENGTVYAWGTFRDSHGSMGLTTEGNEKLPRQMMSEHSIVKIASGTDHLVFLTKHGEVLTCGCGEQGQLGRLPERSCSRNSRNATTGNIQLGKLLVPDVIKTKLSLKLHFDNIWAGHYATFAKVAGEDTFYAFGLNNYAQLGLTKMTHHMPELSREFSNRKLQAISCGQHHTLALDSDGRTFAIGRSEYGRLGLGRNSGNSETTVLTQIPSLEGKKVTTIGAGSSTSFATTEEGVLYSWGMGDGGQLGTGSDEDCYTPMLIESTSLANKKVHKVSSGGQHTVLLVEVVTNNNKVAKK